MFQLFFSDRDTKWRFREMRFEPPCWASSKKARAMPGTLDITGTAHTDELGFKVLTFRSQLDVHVCKSPANRSRVATSK